MKCSLLGLAVLSFVAACTPKLSLDGRPCPCADGYRCCNVFADGQVAGGEPICVPQTSCESHLSADATSVRQGGTVTVTVMATSLASQAVVDGILRDSSGKSANVRVTGTARSNVGGSRVDLAFTVPHGQTPGRYELVFPLGVDGAARSFETPFDVSFISVSPTGSDANGGTHAAPFATITRAIGAAADKDTIDLAGDAVYGVDDLHPRLSLPDGVTLKSDGRMATVRATLDFERNATVRGVHVTMLDAHVTWPGAQIILDDVQVEESGPEGAIIVEAMASLATITITGQSVLKSTASPLVELFAPHAKLQVAEQSTLETRGAAAAIGAHGRESTLLIGDGRAPAVVVRSWGQDAVIEDAVPGSALVSLNRVTLAGFLHVLGETTHVNVVETDFYASGRETTAGIQFRGSHMDVSDSHFYTMGIVQDRPLSEVTLRRCTFSYPTWGYHLTSGSLDLGHAMNPGYNEFTSDSTSAVALWIDGLDGNAAVTSCMSKVNGVIPEPVAVAQPDTVDTVFKLEAKDSVVFYDQ
ncbi:MAG: hypothetical protein JWM82_3016 [Myxococcales bacterium]|nr:hypothetical protein [Myxococcales bacterium]